MLCVFSVRFCIIIIIIIIITKPKPPSQKVRERGGKGKGKGKNISNTRKYGTPRNTLASRLQIYQLLSGSLRKIRSCPHRTLFDSILRKCFLFVWVYERAANFFFFLDCRVAFCILCIYVFDISFIYLGLPSMCRAEAEAEQQWNEPFTNLVGGNRLTTLSAYPCRGYRA